MSSSMKAYAAKCQADLMRQGFMKRRARPRKKAARPWVACELCLDWPRQGTHTASVEERRARKAVRS